MNESKKANSGFSRRNFLRSASAALAAPLIVPSSVFGASAPSNRVNLAAFGVGNRGTADTDGINSHPDARFVAVCDCYEDRREEKRQKWNKLYGGDYVKAYSNPWEVLKRSDIDAVVIATPDHWHVPLAIAAIRAGKDVYVEKPLSVSMQWSRRLRDEMRGKGRILQYGTQQRSDKRFRYACELARNGYVGKLDRVDVWCPDASQQWYEFDGKPTFSVPRYGSLRPAPVPAGLNYDLWCGPAPLRPYTVDRCTSFGAYHIYDYALGFIAGWGAHPLDIAQWGLGTDNTGPVFYEGTGAVPRYGLADTVDEWDIHAYYENGVHMRFMHDRAAKEPVMKYRKRWIDHGTTFFGSEGWVSVDRGGIEFSKPSLSDVTFKGSDTRLYESSHHQRNFIDCVKSRKETISPLEVAIRSDTISHLSNIVVRAGRPVKWDPAREAIAGDEEASRMLDRPMRKEWAV
jgi:predicted dehydrogenase